MKSFVIVIAVIALSAGTVFAQGGDIGVYPDQFATGCSLNEVLFASNTIYVVHTLALSANTAQFRIEHNWTALAGPVNWLSNLTLGDVYTGITVTYVGCKNLPYVLGTLEFLPITATPPCTVFFHVLPDPAVASGRVEVVDCNYQLLFATGGSMGVNMNSTDCPCWVSTERTNWSRIKALYQ